MRYAKYKMTESKKRFQLGFGNFKINEIVISYTQHLYTVEIVPTTIGAKLAENTWNYMKIHENTKRNRNECVVIGNIIVHLYIDRHRNCMGWYRIKKTRESSCALIIRSINICFIFFFFRARTLSPSLISYFRIFVAFACGTIVSLCVTAWYSFRYLITIEISQLTSMTELVQVFNSLLLRFYFKVDCLNLITYFFF